MCIYIHVLGGKTVPSPHNPVAEALGLIWQWLRFALLSLTISGIALAGQSWQELHTALGVAIHHLLADGTAVRGIHCGASCGLSENVEVIANSIFRDCRAHSLNWQFRGISLSFKNCLSDPEERWILCTRWIAFDD